MVNNYNAFNEAFSCFIKGKPITSIDQKETWLDELNVHIANGEAERKTLFTNFVDDQDVCLNEKNMWELIFF